MKNIIFSILLAASFNAIGGEIATYHSQHARKQDVESLFTNSPDLTTFTNHGITEIGIERTGCFGTCPSYTFIVKSDGTFRYDGGDYVDRKGHHTGKVPLWFFHRLANFIKDSNYMQLEDNYSAMITDCATTYTTVTMKGKRKTISNYADTGPIKLWAIEQLIDDLMAKAEWDGAQKPPAKKKTVRP